MKTPKTVRLLVCGIGGRSDRLLCTPGLDVPGSFVSELKTRLGINIQALKVSELKLNTPSL